MGGKFKSTSYSDKVMNIADSFKGMLNNPYYLWTNESGTPCTYYRLNKQLSMVDIGFKFEWSAEGDMSAFKYDKILNFLIFGVDTINLSMDTTEFGPEASSVEGDAIVLPNTIEPCPGDFFVIGYHDMDLMFQVIDVNPDTLENGSNLYRISYHLSRFGKEELEKYNIAKVYHFLVENVGTSLGTLVSDENYNLIGIYDDALAKLREFYIAVFNSNRIQSLIFNVDGYNHYDPYMIEFCKSTNILSCRDQNYYLQHLIDPGTMFPIIYNKTIFRAIIEKNVDKVKYCIEHGYRVFINSQTSIFGCRYEDYYQVAYEYTLGMNPSNVQIDMFDTNFLVQLQNGQLYEEDDKLLYDIIIKYMHDMDITKDDFTRLEYIPYCNTPELFYAIPLAIYCLERTIEKLMC